MIGHLVRRFLSRVFASRQGASEPPAWANFFTARQYRSFLKAVERHFRRRQISCSIADGIVQLGKNAMYQEQQMGLLNLAQMCHQAEESRWGEVIAGHFATIEKSERERKVLEERLKNFDQVAELLAVRLYPDDYPNMFRGEVKDHLIYRQDLEGTVSILVYDMPSAIQNVNPKEADTWGKSLDELFALGLENVWQRCIPDLSRQDLIDGVQVILLSDESFFVASHALLLDRHDDCVGTHGSLIGIPHRHAMLCYPIETIQVVKAVNFLIPILQGMEKEGPGSITSCLYWYKDGHYVNLPYKVSDRKLEFFPPDEFVEMLNALAE